MFQIFKKSWRASSAHTYSVLVSLCGEPSYNKPCPSRRTWWIPAHLSGDMNPSPPPPPNPFALVILCSSKGAEATATCTVYNEHHLQDFLCALGGSAFLGWRQIPADLDLHPAAPLHPATVQVVLPQPQHSCWNHRRLSGAACELVRQGHAAVRLCGSGLSLPQPLLLFSTSIYLDSSTAGTAVEEQDSWDFRQVLKHPTLMGTPQEHC